VPGRTLDDVVTEDGPLHGQALASLAGGLAEALVAVHAAGVVHRDVKPGNVMLFQGTPVVIDFGIAQGPDATRLTMTGMFMGTPGYLAPEVIEGRPSTEASDVHAWGATVGFAATGRPPFGTGPYEGIFYRIVNGQADLAGVPAPLLPLLAAALARDPAHRPPAVQLCAQAAVLDPVSLVQYPLPNGAQAGTMPATGAGATTSDAAPAPAAGGPVAYVPSAPVANGPSGYVPPTVAGAEVNGAAAPPVRGGAAPAPGAGSPHTRPMAQDRPLPNDLGDVLTPVSYARREAAPRRAAKVTGAPRQAAAPAPRTRWHAVLVVATVLMAAGVSVILPVAGTVAALALFAGLRTAGLVQRRSAARRTARGARTMVRSSPWSPCPGVSSGPCSRWCFSRHSRWPPPGSRPASRSPLRLMTGPTVPSPTPPGHWCSATGWGPAPACRGLSSGGSSVRSPRPGRRSLWPCSGLPRSRSPR